MLHELEAATAGKSYARTEHENRKRHESPRNLIGAVKSSGRRDGVKGEAS